MKIQNQNFLFAVFLILLSGCQTKKDDAHFQLELQLINLLRGEITLCGSESGQFGKVAYELSCIESVRANSGEAEKAKEYFQQLITTTHLSDKKRPEWIKAELFLKQTH